MKRAGLLILLIAACGAFALLKFASNGLLVISPAGGSYSVFAGGVQTAYGQPPAFPPYGIDAERWDYNGEAQGALSELDAEILAAEEVCGITIYYAHTSRLPKYIEISYGKINIMAAVRGGKVSIGYPYLDGSY